MIHATFHIDGIAYSRLVDGNVDWSASTSRQSTIAVLTMGRAAADIPFPEQGGFWVEIVTQSGSRSGVADIPRWTDMRCTIRVYGPERWLGIRTVAPHRVFRGVAAGIVFRAAIRDAIVGVAPARLSIGTVLIAGPPIDEIIFKGQYAIDVIVELMDQTGHVFAIDEYNRIHWTHRIGRYHQHPVFDDGMLTRNIDRKSLDDTTGEYLDIDDTGRMSRSRQIGQPRLWPSQKVERV